MARKGYVDDFGVVLPTPFQDILGLLARHGAEVFG